MIGAFKFVLVAGLAAASTAAPAGAQSFDPDAGTGNVLPFAIGASAYPARATAAIPRRAANIVARLNGLHAFAPVPPALGDAGANDPAHTGGGSVGYNQMLLID